MPTLLRTFPLFILALICFEVEARAQAYNVSLIPDSLRRNANAVLRTQVLDLQIKSKSTASYEVVTAITILNEFGDALAFKYLMYDSFQSVEKIEASLYDAQGVKIKSLKKADIRDISVNSAGTDVSDARAKVFGFFYKTYPYTIEFRTIQRFTGLMFLPSWNPVEMIGLSVEESSFQVHCPQDLSLQVKVQPANLSAKQEVLAGFSHWSWELKQFKAIQREVLAPSLMELCPTVHIALKEFEMAGYLGSHASWEQFGDFVYLLSKGRDELPEELKKEVQKIVADKNSIIEKVDTLYRFMQANTRYISVQLGIGGWQPFPAKDVYFNKYGDCKALTNYMAALLKEAGIPSIYTLVRAGSDAKPLMEDFVSSQFNHAILCVPNGKDSIWLECTSQTNPMGYLSDFTSNRKVLLIKNRGSELALTPAYDYNDNRQSRNLHGVVQKDGRLVCELQSGYSGIQQDELHYVIHQKSKQEQLDLLHRKFDLGTYEIKMFRYSEFKERVPRLSELISLEASNYVQLTGKRMIFCPNILNKLSWGMEQKSARRYDVIFKNSFTDVDSVSISIPEGYEVEFLPSPVNLQTPFAEYHSDCSFRDGKLYYQRSLIWYAGRYSASQWKQIQTTTDAINKADKARVAFVRKE